MSDDFIQTLSEHDAAGQIVDTVRQAEAGRAPFVLVLGSGFSHGLVPTARELIAHHLPAWVRALDASESYDAVRQKPAAELAEIARAFWHGFAARNRERGLSLTLDPTSGLPADHATAYKAVFSPRYAGAVGAPAEALRFQRALMRLDHARLNAAHFLLASLLGVQPGRGRASTLFRGRGAGFCRLILTTNFDPFLQTALQAVNRLYFMSDTPELGVGDEIFEQSSDAIHLVYLHGSVHRRAQAATDEDIRALKERNAQTLKPVLRNHGVIVLGYSGWDDTIVEALAACDRFADRLYWCGREPDPLAPGAFGPRVPAILRKTSSVYVPIRSAGRFMARLHNELVVGLPRLLSNPVGQVRGMLEAIDLAELEASGPAGNGGGDRSALLDERRDGASLVLGRTRAIERLIEAERLFLGGAPADSAPTPAAARAEQPAPPGADLLASIAVAEGLENHGEVIRLCSEGLRIGELDAAGRSTLLVKRGRAQFLAGQPDDAVRDWTAVIDAPDVPAALRARACYNRGVARGRADDPAGEIADYSAVIDAPEGVPVDVLAEALNNRGVVRTEQGDHEGAMADFTRLIDHLPGAPDDALARALNNRGVAWGRRKEPEREIADYSRVIDALSGAPVEQVAKALYNRGMTWAQQGDATRATADYTRLIESLPGAPIDKVANALTNRGWLHYTRGEHDRFLADSEAALERTPALVPAKFNLALALLASGRDAEARDAYRKAGYEHPDKVVDYALKDLDEARKTWLTAERAKPVIDILRAIG